MNINLKNIFSHDDQMFRLDMQIIENIHFLLEKKLLRVTREHISSIEKYSKTIDDIYKGKISIIDIEGGGIKHMALKIIGQEYLKSKNFLLTKIEHEFKGIRPDIMAEDGLIILECGNTNPDKIFQYFRNGNTKKIIVIPYPYDEEKYLYVYIFFNARTLKIFTIP